MERWRKGRCKRTIKELSQFDDKKAEELKSEFYHFMWIIRVQLRLSKAVTSWMYISCTNNYLMGITLAKPRHPSHNIKEKD